MRALLGAMESILQDMSATMLLHIGRYNTNVDLGHATVTEDGFALPFPGTNDGYWADDESISNGSGSHQPAEVGEGLEGLMLKKGWVELVRICWLEYATRSEIRMGYETS